MNPSIDLSNDQDDDNTHEPDFKKAKLTLEENGSCNVANIENSLPNNDTSSFNINSATASTVMDVDERLLEEGGTIGAPANANGNSLEFIGGKLIDGISDSAGEGKLNDVQDTITTKTGCEAQHPRVHRTESESQGNHEVSCTGINPISPNTLVVASSSSRPFSDTAMRLSETSKSEKPVGVRREDLIGIDKSSHSTGLQTSVVSSATTVSIAKLDTKERLSQPLAHTIDNISSSDVKVTNNEADVVKKRRAPRKDPKPRLPLENRVYFSKKEVDSAASFLADKEDLCDCLPLDDCFLLGEMFWIFTVKQLELAINESPTPSQPNIVNEMIAKFSHAKSVDMLNIPNVTSKINGDAVAGHDTNVLSMVQQEQSDPFNDVTETSNDGLLLSVTNPPVQESQDVTVTEKSSSEALSPSGEDIHLPQANDVARSRTTSINSNDREVIIKERISVWRQSIATFRSSGKATPIEQRFRLDGPIKLLFPQSTQNFFKSIRLETLWTFLGLRKSETGAICDLMHIWRRECHMSIIPDIGLGRHFLAIAARIETVLMAYPPIPEGDRGWVLDPISGITGAARDFLIRDQKIMSGAYFLSLKTKQLADILETWRHNNGMEKLRGSGKVAMISAWKAYIKEALEAESDIGKVLDLSSYVAKVQNEKQCTFSSANGIPKNKPSDVVNPPSSELVLYSKLVLENVLGEGATALLRSGGIQTAAELFAADMNPATSQLYKTLIETGIVDGIPAFNKAVRNWRHMMTQHFDRLPIGRDPLYLNAVAKSTPLPIDNEDNSRNVSNYELKMDRPGQKPQIVHSSRQIETEAVFDVLSVTTKEFLASMGIYSAYDFLSTRSSAMAVNFVPWRRSKGKPELKGLGSIASISGWKSLVRKKAKDMGLDELAEVEPSSKGIKKRLQQNSYFQQESNEYLDEAVDVESYIEDESATNCMLIGKGLEAENRELFAVQHQGVLYQSVFELSRRKATATEQWKNFITYKGSSNKKIQQGICERVTLNVECVTGDTDKMDVYQPLDAWILPNVHLSRERRGINPGNGNDPLFSSMLSSEELINIGLHGVHPCQDQNLNHLLEVIEKFILQGHIVSYDKCCTEAMYNVLLRKVSFDQFQYLLRVSDPIERGQTVEILFPTIDIVLRRKRYFNSEFEIMHKIDECLRTLSTEDLRKLMTWLSDKAHALPLTKAIENNNEQYGERYVHRKRLNWLARRACASVGQRQGSADITKLATWKDHSDEGNIEYSDAATSQLQIELKYALDHDITCGYQARNRWSSEAQVFFESVISCIAHCLNASLHGEWLPLSELIKSVKCSGDVGQTPIASNTTATTSVENIEMMDVEENVAVSSELEKRTPDPMVTDTTTSALVELSNSLIWQVVNSVFEAAQIDFLNNSSKYSLESVLPSLRTILFNNEATVQDAQPIRYNLPLLLSPSTFFKPDTSVIPNTFTIFLGLVWPVLRKYGWRIAAGSSPNEIKFMPKSVSRKRWGAIKQRRDRQSAKLEREMKSSGFHLISKTTKRLLLTMATDTDDSVASYINDIEYDKNRTVQAALDRFQAWLLEKCDKGDDPTVATTTELVRNVVSMIGECFDSCATMLAPISNLTPNWNFEGEPISRPVAAYRCEYLVPFLVNFLSRDVMQSDLDLSGLACDLLFYISKHYKDIFDQRFHPPAEAYVESDDPSLWIENHICTFTSKRQGSDDTTSPSDDCNVTVNEGQDIHSTPHASGSSNVELFEVLLDDEKVLVSDFIRIILENTNPFIATENDLRRKSGRLLGAPGLVCRHCLAKHGEGKYFFSSIDSLSTCYPVLEKHYNKCPDCPEEIKASLSDARNRHTYQRKNKPCGSQQSFFIKLWNRMVKCKPEIATIQRWAKPVRPSSSTDKLEHLSDDMDYDGNNIDDLNADNDDDSIFTDHRAVLDYLHKEYSGGNASKSNELQEIQESLDSYYGCIEYAGRIYGTPSMPKHFSTYWLLSKMIGPKDYADSSNQYVG